jgi:hypothetical protein
VLSDINFSPELVGGDMDTVDSLASLVIILDFWNLYPLSIDSTIEILVLWNRSFYIIQVITYSIDLPWLLTDGD